MHPPSFYREQAERTRRLASLAHQSELIEMLHRMAEEFEDIAQDLETGTVDVHHPELLPQRSGDR